MSNKPIPLSAARSKKSNKRNYNAPKKGDPAKGAAGDDPDVSLKPQVPKAPKDKRGRNVLGPEGMREWRRITKLLANAKIVAEVDRAVLTQYCMLWEQMLTGKDEFKAAQHTQLRLCAVELGLTPSARTRLRG